MSLRNTLTDTTPLNPTPGTELSSHQINSQQEIKLQTELSAINLPALEEDCGEAVWSSAKICAQATGVGLLFGAIPIAGGVATGVKLATVFGSVVAAGSGLVAALCCGNGLFRSAQHCAQKNEYDKLQKEKQKLSAPELPTMNK